MSNKHTHVLCVQMPNQPQTFLGYPNEESATAAARNGIKEGVVECVAEAGLIIVHTVPGTVYMVLTKQQLDRQMMQQQLLMRQQGH